MTEPEVDPMVLPAPLAFVDCETTGLDPERHEIWEVAVVTRSWAWSDGEPWMTEQAHEWFLPVDLGSADPISLKIGGFHARHPHGYDFEQPEGDYLEVTPLRSFARQFADATRGCHLIGAVPSFDERRLGDLLRRNGACPDWHYHLVCVENMAYGFMLGREGRAFPLPWDSSALTAAVGADPSQHAKHTAMGDVRWAMDAWDCMHREVSP